MKRSNKLTLLGGNRLSFETKVNRISEILKSITEEIKVLKERRDDVSIKASNLVENLKRNNLVPNNVNKVLKYTMENKLFNTLTKKTIDFSELESIRQEIKELLKLKQKYDELIKQFEKKYIQLQIELDRSLKNNS